MASGTGQQRRFGGLEADPKDSGEGERVRSPSLALSIPPADPR